MRRLSASATCFRTAPVSGRQSLGRSSAGGFRQRPDGTDRKAIVFSNPPGIAYEYSNLGFALLGKIITVVSGMPYQDYIKKYLGTARDEIHHV